MAIHPLPVSLRIDAPDSLEQKARLLQLSPAQIQATEQAGDEIEFPCYTAAAYSGRSQESVNCPTC